MSRQIGIFNHEKPIGALVAITVQLFFLIPQKSVLAEIGGEGIRSCPHSFILFPHDWQIGFLISNCVRRLANTSGFKHHGPHACGSGPYTFSVHIIQPFAIFHFWLHRKTRCNISKRLMINLPTTPPPQAVKSVGGTHIQNDCPLYPLSNDALWSQPSPLIAQMQMGHSRTHDPCIRWAGFCCVEQKMWTQYDY